MSTGKPSEKNLYADIDAAWHALRTQYGISPENIILYGQSIGTVPTVDLASRYKIFYHFITIQQLFNNFFKIRSWCGDPSFSTDVWDEGCVSTYSSYLVL